MANRGGFSWKRFLGVTKAKRRISRATGIPLTRSGRQRKMGAAMGCCVPLAVMLITIVLSFVLIAFAHPGRTDENGGHGVTDNDWGYEVGTYHIHDRNGSIIPVDENTLLPTEITVSVDGERIIFDQKPINTDGRVMVPVRYVVEKLGCTVEWDGGTQTVYISNSECEKAVNDLSDVIEVVVNGEQVVFDVLPQNINGRILIPIRAVVEKLGCEVEWDGALQTVYITSKIASDNTRDSLQNGGVMLENVTYILNTSSKKFHSPSCKNADTIAEQNKSFTEKNRDMLISEGYSPCGACKP